MMKTLIQRYGARRVSTYTFFLNLFSLLIGIVFSQILILNQNVTTLSLVFIPVSILGIGASILIYHFNVQANQVANGTYVEHHDDEI